ncbi:MAG: glycosyltransferase [Bacteroidetes bacterium]|nr:glycosyltransferase [Bacteroidota bacterium]
MKILLLTNKLPYPPKDGGSIATLNMITGLSDAGHQVTCLSLNTVKHSFPIEKIPGSLSGRIRFIGIHCDSSIRPARMLSNLLFSKIPYIAERFNKPDFRLKLLQLLGEEEFDLVQMEGPYLGHYLDTVQQNSSAAISFRAHNVEHRIWERKAANERFPFRRAYLMNMAKRLKEFELQVAEKSTCLVTISPLDEKAFREMGVRKPIITIPTGIDLHEYPSTELPGEPSVFFIGALDWLPNQEGLLWFLDHVIDPLRSEVPEVTFHVAGRNAPSSFETLLSRNQVIYHGEVADSQKFIRSHRIMVAPLFTGSGIRIKILEAMALGRPVVTTPIGIEGIPARNNREIMTSDDPEIFKNQIIKLIREEDTPRDLVSAGRKLIQENFNNFGLSTRITRFFKEQV